MRYRLKQKTQRISPLTQSSWRTPRLSKIQTLAHGLKYQAQMPEIQSPLNAVAALFHNIHHCRHIALAHHNAQLTALALSGEPV